MLKKMIDINMFKLRLCKCYLVPLLRVVCSSFSLKLLMLLGILMTIIWVPYELWSQNAYELVCRGGGDLYFQYTPFSNFSSQPQILLTFKKGRQGIGNNWSNLHTLEPGQCAWLDRAIKRDEPDRILINIKVFEFSISWNRGRVMGISSSLPYLSNLQDSSSYQSFFVYNDGRGNFIVTKIGKSKLLPR